MFRRDGDIVFKLFLGSIIMIVPVVNLMGLGYLQLCLRQGMKGRTALPPWHDWKSLFQKGLEALLIAVIYMLGPLVFALLFLSIPLLGLLGAALLITAAFMMIPLAWANHEACGAFSDAFRWGEMYARVCCQLGRYILIYTLHVLVISIGCLLVFQLTFLGLLGGMMIFISGVTLCFYVGSLYRSC
jgi:hypothetical protein